MLIEGEESVKIVHSKTTRGKTQPTELEFPIGGVVCPSFLGYRLSAVLGILKVLDRSAIRNHNDSVVRDNDGLDDIYNKRKEAK